MRVLPIPDAFPASSSKELLALPLLIAQPPLPSQRSEASFHKYRGVSRSLRCLAIGTAVARPAVDGLHPAVKTDLLMSPDQRRPIELLGPLPPVTLRGWDGISAVGRGSAGLRGALHYIIPSPPAPSRRTIAVEEAAFLVSVQRIIRRIKIEDDLCRWAPIRLQEYRDKQRLNRRRLWLTL